MNLYYCDWLAMAASVTALALIGQRNRFGFISFIVANLAWIGCGLMLANLPIILGNVLFLVLNIRGYVNWTTNAPT